MNEARISPEAADEAVHRALTLFIGRGRAWSVTDIEAGTGIPVSTVQKWITPDPLERRRPKGCHLLLIAQFVGVAFTDKLLGPIGQGGRDLDAREGTPGHVIAHLAAGGAAFAEAGADGRFDHIDHGRLEPIADDMIQILTPFASKKPS